MLPASAEGRSNLDSGRTARPKDRFWGDGTGSPNGLYFPKGDVGTHMFGRGFATSGIVDTKLDGENWTGRNLHGDCNEVGSAAQNKLRVYRSASSPFLQYSMNRERFPKSRYWG